MSGRAFGKKYINLIIFSKVISKNRVVSDCYHTGTSNGDVESGMEKLFELDDCLRRYAQAQILSISSCL